MCVSPSHPPIAVLGRQLSFLTHHGGGELGGWPLWGRASRDLDQPHPGLSWEGGEERADPLFLPVLSSRMVLGHCHLSPICGINPKRKEAFTIESSQGVSLVRAWHGACRVRKTPMPVSRGSGRAGLLLCTMDLAAHECWPSSLGRGHSSNTGQSSWEDGGRWPWCAGHDVSSRASFSVGTSEPRHVAGDDGTADPNDARNRGCLAGDSYWRWP